MRQLLPWAAAVALLLAPTPADAQEPAEPSAEQEGVWQAVHAAGGSAAMLPAACMPSDGELLMALTEAEGVASRRMASPMESASGMPGDADLLDALSAEGGAAIAASLSFLAAAYPALEAPSFSPEPGCDPRIVAAAANWGTPPRADWPRVRDGIEAAFATGPIPNNIVRRASVHWYLDTRAAALELLAALAAEATPPAGPSELALLTALAAGARGDADAMIDALAGAPLPPPPDPALPPDPDAPPVEHDAYLFWVHAEAHRQAGSATTALRHVATALEADPFFAPAYFTRASALIASNRGDEALADLEFLRRTFGSGSVYGRWIEALASALR